MDVQGGGGCIHTLLQCVALRHTTGTSGPFMVYGWKVFVVRRPTKQEDAVGEGLPQALPDGPRSTGHFAGIRSIIAVQAGLHHHILHPPCHV
jgi:hypothetical protein